MKIENAKYLVLATCFHGGGLISAHRSLAQAIKSMNKNKFSDCLCGCAGIVDLSAKDTYSYFYGNNQEYCAYIRPKSACVESVEDGHYSSLQYQF